MKKKALFLLASVGLGAALVGATFANWAVTDNADPFSIKVSTGEVSSDTTEYVTLEWGSSQSMSHVANLAPETVRKAGVLDLRANTNSKNSPDGTLSYQLSGGSHLLDKLELKFYRNNLDATDGVISAETIAAATEITGFVSGSKLLSVEKNVANPVTVAVNLKSVTAADLDAMSGEEVSIRFDWGPGSNLVPEDATKTLYAYGFAGQPYAYAYNEAKVNAKFPGVKMSEVVAGSGVYTVEIPAAMETVIFSTGHENDQKEWVEDEKSGDIVIATSFDGKDMFHYTGEGTGAKGEFEVYDPSAIKVPTYYVVGSFTGTAPDYWTADENYKLTLKEGETDIYELKNVVLAKDAELKVYGGQVSTETWFSNASTWDDCHFTIANSGNIVVSAAGTYTIEFDLSPLNNNYIVLK